MSSSSQSSSHRISTVQSLRPEMSGLHLIVKVIKVESTDDEIDLLTVKKPTRLVNCLVGDETACIRFVARREQVEQLQEDIYLQLDNAKINMTRGTMRLFLNKSGTATAVQNVFFEPKSDVNMSSIDFELVPVADMFPDA